MFQSSCKHRIAASFAFKQKRSLQLSAQPTLMFQLGLPRYCNNFSLTGSVIISHSSTAFSQFLGSNGTELGLNFIFFAILRASGVGKVKILCPLPFFDSISTFSAAPIHNPC